MYNKQRPLKLYKLVSLTDVYTYKSTTTVKTQSISITPKVSLCPRAAHEPPPPLHHCPRPPLLCFLLVGVCQSKCFGGNKPIATRLSMTTSPPQLTGLPLGNTQTGPCPRAFAGAVPFAGWLFLQVAASSLPSGLCPSVTLSGGLPHPMSNGHLPSGHHLPVHHRMCLAYLVSHICLPLWKAPGQSD